MLDFYCDPQPLECFEFILIDHHYTALALLSTDGAGYKNLNTGEKQPMACQNNNHFSCPMGAFSVKLGIHDKEVVVYQGDFTHGTECIGAQGMPPSMDDDLLHISFQTNCRLIGYSSGIHSLFLISILVSMISL